MTKHEAQLQIKRLQGQLAEALTRAEKAEAELVRVSAELKQASEELFATQSDLYRLVDAAPAAAAIEPTKPKRTRKASS
jgi:peptidoglycan hydrolase CwlO-like protein